MPNNRACQTAANHFKLPKKWKDIDIDTDRHKARTLSGVHRAQMRITREQQLVHSLGDQHGHVWSAAGAF